jgi:lipoprotein signal peptidase
LKFWARPDKVTDFLDFHESDGILNMADVFITSGSLIVIGVLLVVRSYNMNPAEGTVYY